jgi:hypothetical protein
VNWRKKGKTKDKVLCPELKNQQVMAVFRSQET